MAAVTAYAVLWYASRPADPTHAYGHEKIEYFSSGLEGVLIIVAGLGAAGYAIRRLIYPEPLLDLEIGTLIGLAASGVNLIAARVLLHYGKQAQLDRPRSGRQAPDGRRVDVGRRDGGPRARDRHRARVARLDARDPGGANIVWTGGELVYRSFNGLMDHALPADEQEQIRGVIRAHLPEGADFHLLRTRQAGARRFVEFHLLVDGDQTVARCAPASRTRSRPRCSRRFRGSR